MTAVQRGRPRALPAILVSALVSAALLAPATAAAAPGGMAAHASTTYSAAMAEPAAALLAGDRAIPPLDAPPRVRAVISAANRIRHRPYIWGGGHGSWRSRGYDCSGAVSYALHGGGFLRAPLTSGAMMHAWEPGPGRWITVYANGGHAYMEVAGLRWDTVGDATGTGPRWHQDPPYPRGFAMRHPAGY